MASSARLIGREEPLARLEAAASAAAGGRARIVLIEGDAGIGKSRLVTELTNAAQERGAKVLSGACPPVAGPDLPLAAIAQALRGLVAAGPADELDAVIGASRPVLALLAPSLATAGDPAPGGTSLGLLFEHILLVLERLTARHPLVVLAIDDLHWGGPSTWDLVAHLARNLAGLRVLVIATFRRDDLAGDDRASKMLVELRRAPAVEILELEPLAPDAAGELVAELGPPKTGAASIAARSGGNPYFAEELVAAAGDRGGDLPESLRSMLLERVDAEPPEVVALVRAAAIVGRPVDPDLIVEVAGLPPDRAEPALRRASRAGLLEVRSGAATQEAAIPHDLLRDVVVREILPAERSRLHGAAARALSARNDPDASRIDRVIELATHWRESGDVLRAVPALLRAAEAARSSYAFVEAHRMYEQAFASTDGAGAGSGTTPATPGKTIGFRPPAGTEGPEWAGIRAAAAEAASLAGEPARAVERVDAALAHEGADPRDRLRWLIRRARYLLEAGLEDQALAAYRELADRADDLAPADRPRLLVAHARALASTGRYDEAGTVAEAALAAARDARQDVEEQQALNVVGTALAHAGRSEEGLAALAEARRLAIERRPGSTGSLEVSRISEMLGGQLDMARALEHAGRTGEALEVALEATSAAGRLGAARWQGELDLAATRQLFLRGQWAEARARCDAQLANDAQRAGGAAGARGGPGGQSAPTERTAEALVLRARIGVAEGRWAEAEADLAAAAVRIARSGRTDLVASDHLARAELASWRRRPADGLVVVDEGLAHLADSEDRLARAELCLVGLRLAVELHEEARLRRSAAELAERAEDVARWHGELRALLGDATGLREAAMRAQGDAEPARVAGLDRDAASAWAGAAEHLDALPDPYATAYALWRKSEAVLGGSEGRSKAAADLRRAAQLADGLGAAPLLAELRALAGRARISLDKAATEEPAKAARPGTELRLSERELEVLILVAEGRTNRQIADELFITEKTAGHHVSNILGKLDAANRLEAAAIAHRAGVTRSAEPG